MTSLDDFKVDEKKGWFGEYWLTGVPKQITEVSNVRIDPYVYRIRRKFTRNTNR